MDAKLARLDAAVALRADAWLAAPTDPGLYARLVTAVLERRAYLHPGLDTTPDPDPPAQPDEVLDELAEHGAPRTVGEDDLPAR